ncbi:MAG: metal-sulfur cluster assembly factor [Chloroflexota bacterium]|nr:MAG: aromatic ring hydroxylase [Chloroflexota bacterium]
MAISTEDVVREALKEVYDPEIGVNIVDLGLVYDLDLEQNGTVSVTMTFTTPACPLGPVIEQEVKNALVGNVPGVTDTRINLVWTPPWTPDMMSEDAKLELGFW